MKKFRAIFAMLTAIIMAFGMSPIAYAAEGDRTFDQTISVTDLQQGDKVAYYQVIKWGENDNWALADGFTELADPTIDDIINGINQAQADKIAALANGATAKGKDMAVSDGGTWSVTPSESGLYMVIVTAGTPGVIYNPVFVAADYDSQNATNTISITANYKDSAVPKKSTVTVDKTAAAHGNPGDDASANKVGDLVDFTIETTIPVYLDSYKNPSFKITDTVTSGLSIDPNSVSIAYGEKTATGITENEDLTLNATATGVTVDFKANYLSDNASPVDVTVTYTAEVTNAAIKNVNQDKNTVTVEYSNGPGNEKGAVGDGTTHYTFSIGADIFGPESQTNKTTIIRKVKLEGNQYHVVTEENGTTTTKDASALPGATFTLYTNADCKDEHKYTNDLFSGTVKSDTDGLITIKGLDDGIYWLKETDAPAGYIKDDTAHKIEIIPTYETRSVTETIDDITVTYDVKILTKYDVKYDDTIKSTYRFTNEGPNITTMTTETDEPSFIVNNAGTELPSTGGIGTTIFYVVGGVMVAGAAIFLLTKRRANTAE